jgi:hypothetical protein
MITRRFGRKASLATLLLLSSLSVSGPAQNAHSAPTPAEACAIAKNKAAVKKVAARAKCWQKAIAAGEAAASPDCLAAAETKFAGAIAKAESKDGCLVTGDASEIGSAADSCIDGLVAVTPPTTSTSTTTTSSTTITTTTIELSLWYQDLDGDGTGNPAVTLYSATQPAGYVPSHIPTDCDDNDPLRHPGRRERCDLVLDSDCNAATPDCPAGCYGYQRPGGSLYMVCTTLRDRNDAAAYCNGFQSPRLAKIDDAAENQYVWAIATYHFGTGSNWWWIGGQPNPSSSWAWPDGSVFWPANGSYTNWAPGEPSSTSSAYGMQMSGSGGMNWKAALYYGTAPYVCEWY